jgi:hypothetical protein
MGDELETCPTVITTYRDALFQAIVDADRRCQCGLGDMPACLLTDIGFGSEDFRFRNQSGPSVPIPD